MSSLRLSGPSPSDLRTATGSQTALGRAGLAPHSGTWKSPAPTGSFSASGPRPELEQSRLLAPRAVRAGQRLVLTAQLASFGFVMLQAFPVSCYCRSYAQGREGWQLE